MQLIDTHAHVYLPEFDADREAIITAANDIGITRIIMPAIDTHTHDAMLAVEAEYEECTAMMGLHPCSVTGDYQKELEVVEDWLARRPFLAVGEIGLDFYWDKTFTEQQYAAFRYQCELALRFGLPICIHSRNAIDECIGVVKEYPGLRGVFHCFSGNGRQAEEILTTSFYLGIGGVVTFKNSGLDKVVETVGLERVILETDAPYLAPVPYRGKRNQPAYTGLVAERLAALLGLPLEKVAELTTENAKKLFTL
jgi:TatD DNase family protein